MERLSNDFATTLNGAINDTVTAITVLSGAGAPAANFRIRVDDELMLVTSKGAGTNWTVERHLEGTVAASHANGADVAHVISFGGLDAYGMENFASQFPGAISGAVRLVPASFQLVVVEELVVEGELILDGAVYIMPLS